MKKGQKILSSLILVVCLLIPGLSRANDWKTVLGTGVVHKDSLGPILALGVFVPHESKHFLPGVWINLWATDNTTGAFIGKGMFLNLAHYTSLEINKTLSKKGIAVGLNTYVGLRYMAPEDGASFLAPALHLGLGAAGSYSGHDLFGEVFCETATRGAPVWGGIVKIPF